MEGVRDVGRDPRGEPIVGMAKLLAHDADVGAGLELQGGVAMAEVMQPDPVRATGEGADSARGWRIGVGERSAIMEAKTEHKAAERPRSASGMALAGAAMCRRKGLNLGLSAHNTRIVRSCAPGASFH